ncbi:hypothetical protein AHF37_11503 [Paragonimus kellicotti]|nr:hypothetical protein AHF37_11503 [Paragonimus kellicotti]
MSNRDCFSLKSTLTGLSNFSNLACNQFPTSIQGEHSEFTLTAVHISNFHVYGEIVLVTSLCIPFLSLLRQFSLCLLHDLPVRVRFSPFRRWPWLRTYFEPDYFHLRRVHMLRFRSQLLFAEDRIVDHELRDPGWVNSISSSELKDLCSLRGIKTMHKSTEESTKELKRWISISLNVSNSNHAYRLHLPAFLFNSCSD